MPLPIFDNGAQEPVAPTFGSGAQEPVSNINEAPVTTLPYYPGGENNGTSPPATNAGGFDFSQFLQGLGGQGLSMASLIPALATAMQQYKNAGKYGDLGREAAGMASPVSLEERQRQQARLNLFYEDPTKFLESNPEFMASKRLGEKALFSKNNAMGFGGSGRATNDQLRFLSDLSARYVGKERDDLMHMGGYQFDPGNAASMLMKGGEQEIKAKTAALAALLYPFGPGAAGPGGGGGPGGEEGGIVDMIRRALGGGGGTRSANPNSMNGGLGAGVNSLAGLFGIANGFGPGLQEIYGNTTGPGWNYMPEGWANQTLGPVGWEQWGNGSQEPGANFDFSGPFLENNLDFSSFWENNFNWGGGL